MAIFWYGRTTSAPKTAGAQIHPNYNGFFWKGPAPLDPLCETRSSNAYVPTEARYDITLHDAGLGDYLYISGLADGSDWCVAETVMDHTLKTITRTTKFYPPAPGAPNRGAYTIPPSIAFYGEIPAPGYTYQHLLWYDIRTTPHSLLIYDTFRNLWRSSAPAPVNLTGDVRLSQSNWDYFRTGGNDSEVYVVGEAAMLIYRPFSNTWSGPYPIPEGDTHYPAFGQFWDLLSEDISGSSTEIPPRRLALCLFRGATVYRWNDPGWTQTTSAPGVPSSVCSGASANNPDTVLYLNAAGTQFVQGQLLDPLAVKFPDNSWQLIHYPATPMDTGTWIDNPLKLKTATGWTEQSWSRGSLLQTKDPAGHWRPVATMWTPEDLTPHPAIWVMAEDMDVRDGDRVWEMFSQIPGGPPLIDSDLDIVGDELTPGSAYTDDPNTGNSAVPASGKQVRLRHDVNGRPVALLRNHAGDAVPYANRLAGELNSPWWAPSGSSYQHPFDLVHGSTTFMVFRLLGTGLYIEISNYAGTPDSEGTMFIAMDRGREVYFGSYRYDSWYVDQDAYTNAPAATPEQPVLNQLYVLETTVHLAGGLSMRLNGNPLSMADSYYDGPDNYPKVGDAMGNAFIRLQTDTAPDGTYRGDLGFYLYEYKMWSGELTENALAAERAYFSNKYGVPT